MKHVEVRRHLTQAVVDAGLSRQVALEDLRRVALATLAELATYEPETGLRLKPDALAHPALESVERSFDAEGRERIKITRESKIAAWTRPPRRRRNHPGQGSTRET